MSGTAERRAQIMRILCKRRSETINNLAMELGVSGRTIRRDIDVLSASEPIYTLPGRYGGGVYVTDTYSIQRIYMSPKELAVLNKLADLLKSETKCLLTDDEYKLLLEIIEQYTKPEIPHHA